MRSAVGEIDADEPARNEDRVAVVGLDGDLRGQNKPLLGDVHRAIPDLGEGVEQHAALHEAARAQGYAEVKRVDRLVAGVVGQPAPYVHASEAGEERGAERDNDGDGGYLHPPGTQVSP